MKKNEHYEYPNIRFHVSETCVLLLEEIKGEVVPDNLKQATNMYKHNFEI